MVDWQAFAGDIRLPDAHSVSVDPSNGSVFAFTDFRRPYAAPPQPKIGRDEAVERATAASGLTAPTVDSAELKVDFAADGTQILVWEIALTAGISHALVQVDALAGSARIVGRG